jgi:AraC-like DNA-binding protein
MAYCEHPAPARLAPWLACTWQATAGAARTRVIPDGSIDIVWIEGRGAQIAGANTTAFLVELAPGTPSLGVRFRPGAAGAILGIAAEQVRDAHVPLAELLGEDGARLAASLDDGESRIATLHRELDRLSRTAAAPDPLIGALLPRLGRPLPAISHELGVSERQLRRRVTRAVGYGPKRLARVLRLQAALAAARGGSELARAAYEAGFADQAHFTNECSELAGLPPAALLAGDVSGTSKTPGAVRATITA